MDPTTHISAPTPARRMRDILWPPPEPELAGAGRSGEIVIAKARLFVLALLLLPSIATCMREPGALSGWLGLCIDSLALILGIHILHRARSDTAGQALATVATILDVSLVSTYYVLLFLGNDASTALGSRVLFSLYIIAIIGTALRYDGRLVRFAGLLAVVQYPAVVALAHATGLTDSIGASFPGDTTLAGQSEEVCILLVTTVLGAIIVERARELRLSGIRDPLTKLANRSYFSERFQSELQRAGREQRPAAVAMIDIDHFKQVNDTHGHAAGDVVLQRVAAELRRWLRQDELVARLGGEEFAMLLFDRSREETQRRLDAIRMSMRSTGIELAHSVGIRVTVSMGLAMSPDDGTEATRLLEVADARMLAGKRAGRDVVVASG
jgi:diguanylate cyclase (GGDEF)-like protein